MIRTFKARRVARLVCVACATAPGTVRADEAAEPIVVIATPERSPATAESVSMERLRETTATISTEDSVRYLPSLLVRKRHAGDTQAPLATRTSGVGASARSLIYADGVLLSALIGNNNNTASPRWGMVAPEEIERVDVLYGPFMAAYSGNSIGAVVNITTRLPERTEATLTAATSLQSFGQYGTSSVYPSRQLAGSFGSKFGPLSVFLAANHLDSRGQPLAYATVARPAATGTGGLPVSGAYEDVNRTGSPIFVLGATGIEHHVHDTLKLKASLELSPHWRVTYLGGLFLNDTKASAEAYLSGTQLSGSLNIAGRPVVVPASAFSNNVYRFDERHWMHALSASGRAGGIDFRANGSIYRFAKSAQRIPSGALPQAASGGAGSIVRLDGTGWDTFDISATRSSTSFGAHRDRVRLRNRRHTTADWISGDAGPVIQAAEGRTATTAVWAQQAIALAPDVELTLGSRYEWWRADRGRNVSLSPVLDVFQPVQRREAFSPKATLGWQADDAVKVTLSAAQAYRFPTVQELYQAISTGPTISVPDPNLKPERARSAELAVEHRDASGNVRLSLFGEWIVDALISQSAPLLPGSTALFNYVQNVPKVRTRGIELSFDRRGMIAPGLDIAGSVTLADPRIVRDPVFPAAEGKRIPQVPKRRATLVATWRESDAAAFTLAARYSSRLYGTIDNGDIVGHTFQGFEGYFVVDARALFRVCNGLEVAFGVENLGNHKYYLFHPFPQRSVTAELRWRM